MKQLFFVFVLWSVATVAEGDTGDFGLHIGEGTSDYEFIFENHNAILLVIHEDGCYYARIWPRLSDDLLFNTYGDFQELVKFIINSPGHERKHQTTMDEVSHKFRLHQNNSKCLSRDIYIVSLDYVECDFERETYCLWSLNLDGTLQWQFNKGETPTLLTGPDADHTVGTANEGRYIYLEANDGSTGEVASLISTTIAPESQGMCLRFWYSMYGSEVGQLEVIAEPTDHNIRPKNISLWKQQGNQGRGWHEAQVAVDTSEVWAHHVHTIQLSIRATRGPGTEGDIAIDDISSSPGPCPVSALDCSFDNHVNLCNWKQVSVVDQMNWIKRHSSTSTNATGPHASTNSSDYYIYVEGNYGNPGDTADLQSPLLHLSGPICLSFSYSMFGSGVGELDVVLLDRSRMHETVMWSRSGDQGYGWIIAHVPVIYSDPNIPLQVLFRATRGRSEVSDIAIDDVVGQSGACQQYIAGTPIIG